MLRRELDTICDTWNSHRIKNTITTDVKIPLAGRPDVIYFTFSDKHLHPINRRDIELYYDLQQGNIEKSYTCSTEFFELPSMLVNEDKLHEPTNYQGGLNLFTKLCEVFFSLCIQTSTFC